MRILSFNQFLLIAASIGLVSLSHNAIAGDPEAGKAKSAVCAGCHGVDGNSQIPTNPRIAGQYEDYLVFSLTSYRDGQRQNAIMSGIASALSDEDIEDLSAWFASQEGLGILNKNPM